MREREQELIKRAGDAVKVRLLQLLELRGALLPAAQTRGCGSGAPRGNASSGAVNGSGKKDDSGMNLAALEFLGGFIMWGECCSPPDRTDQAPL